jgi:gag-polyprotein putative aspartyl protease
VIGAAGRLTLFLCVTGALLAGRETAAARPSASVTLASGLASTRTTIPVSIDGRRTTCILDTGSSVNLVSPELARSAGLIGEAGTFEIAPDGHSYLDRETQIANFGVAGYTLHDVHALISGTLTGSSALCGYDFLTRFPLLIDRENRQVTLFPTPAKVAHLHCVPITLTSRVALATVEINGTRLDQIVLDSGMAGGGALWEGVQARLREPLIESSYYGDPSQTNGGFTCGASALVRFAAGTSPSEMAICTEPRRPDGYNGIIETNLPSVHAMAVDYPHRKMCFDVNDFTQAYAAPAKLVPPTSEAWARYNSLRPPPR